MKSKRLSVRCWVIVVLLCCALLPLTAWGDDFADYDSNGKKYDINLPAISAGWFVAVDFFPNDTAAMIGPYEAEGRALAANGTTLYMQKNYGVGQWIPVATVTAAMTMDPCFVHVSPDGSKVAPGLGWQKPLLIFNPAILNDTTSPVLDTDTRVTAYNVDYYDAEWLDNQYMVLNGGKLARTSLCKRRGR